MGEIIDKAKGKAKQAAGVITDDKNLQTEGEIDEATGKAKGLVNRVVEAAEDAAKKVKDAVKRI
jgi:uncharacterized protein YjbJ (UPF0337 family)